MARRATTGAGGRRRLQRDLSDPRRLRVHRLSEHVPADRQVRRRQARRRTRPATTATRRPATDARRTATRSRRATSAASRVATASPPAATGCSSAARSATTPTTMSRRRLLAHLSDRAGRDLPGRPASACRSRSAATAIDRGGRVAATTAALQTGWFNGLFFGDGIGCSKTCTKEPKCRDAARRRAPATRAAATATSRWARSCDDGNLADGDGCSATCKRGGGLHLHDQMRPDTETCTSGSGSACKLPVIFRDFKSEKETGGHPDFFYLGAPITGGPSITGVEPGQTAPSRTTSATACRTRAARRRKNDSVGALLGISRSDTLDARGKPVFNTARNGGGANASCATASSSTGATTATAATSPAATR